MIKAQDIGGSLNDVARNCVVKKYLAKGIHAKTKRVECFFQRKSMVFRKLCFACMPWHTGQSGISEDCDV